MKRRLFRKSKRFGSESSTPSGEVPLQITSMADIFTILLVFLLKGAATSSATIQPTAGLALPHATGSAELPEALQIEISADAITLDQSPVLALQQFGLPKELTPLSQALQEKRNRQNVIAAANSEVKADPRIVIIADQNTPHSTWKAVLTEAALAGYTEPKLVVMKQE